jgi:hypothetical protein
LRWGSKPHRKHNFDVLSEEDAEVLMVSCVPCTHRPAFLGRRHPSAEGHREMEDVL